MAAKEIAVKKCVVKLSMEQREPLDTLIRSGKHPARKLTRARILLKAEAGEGWSDSQVAAALDIGLATVARVGQRGIRGRHGRRAGGLSQTERSGSSGGLCGRDLKALTVETRVPIPAKPGQPAPYDYEYLRNSTANLFMMFAPLEGWRHVKVTDRHTAVDYAQVLKDLSDKHYPNAAKVVLVQDNLNTHKPASLCEAFPA